MQPTKQIKSPSVTEPDYVLWTLQKVHWNWEVDTYYVELVKKYETRTKRQFFTLVFGEKKFKDEPSELLPMSLKDWNIFCTKNKKIKEVERDDSEDYWQIAGQFTLLQNMMIVKKDAPKKLRHYYFTKPMKDRPKTK